MNVTVNEAKRAARVVREELGADNLTYSQALEIVAHQLGFRDWNAAAAILARPDGMGVAIPVVRILDEERAREFYLGFLGFAIEWEHRFEPGLPLYARLRRDQMMVDLSEHHGDGAPGSVTWVAVDDLAALQRELLATSYARMRPDIDPHAPGGPTMEVIDPFSNTIRFCQPSKRVRATPPDTPRTLQGR